jgi:mannosyl-3-phosphoglycerate phosphatase
LGGHRWILFTDLDGTLLDKETYEPGPSLEALGKCRDADLPVVFCSSKTGAEILLYHERYAPHPESPFISENGGGVFFPKNRWPRPPGGEEKGGFWRVTLGARHEEVVRVLVEAAGSVGVNVRTFSGMTTEEISRGTGLSLEEARLAGERDFDEPFWIEGEADPDTLAAFGKAIEEGGMRWTRGGRCFHVHGPSDKGKAVRCVRQRYEEVVGDVRAAAVGDAANDLPMFRVVDRAYLVKQTEHGHDPDVPKEGNIRFLSGIGPFGFSQAVDDLLEIGRQGSV